MIAFHYLRHTCATWLLDAGMPVTEVSKRLGHWAPSFTLDRYSHTVAVVSASWPVWWGTSSRKVVT